MKNMDIKKEYLKTLDEYIAEQIFIVDNPNHLEKEIDKNYWWISGTHEQINSLSFTEWMSFFKRLITNRENQLNSSKIKTNLIFYCYNDELAGQIRFNVISAAHTSLPFGCKYIEDTLENILNDFLKNNKGGFISFDELISISIDEAKMLEKVENDQVIKVYVKKLVQNNNDEEY